MSALQRDSDLLWQACEGLNTLASLVEGRVSFRLSNGSPASAAAMEKVADLIRQAHAEADKLSFQFARDAALDNPRPVRTLELI